MDMLFLGHPLLAIIFIAAKVIELTDMLQLH